MTTANEKRFFTRIQSALKVPANAERDFSTLFPSRSDEETRQQINQISDRTKTEQQRLLDQLIEAGKPINLTIIPLADIATAAKKITALIIEKKPEWGHEKRVSVWQHPIIDQLNLSQGLENEKVSIHPTVFPDNLSPSKARQQIHKDITASFIGITSADYCVAESATLVMKTQPGQARATSLLPSIHIAVIRMDQIIANLNELFTLLTHEPGFNRLSLTNCLTFISGPSKTADIEATMVHGAHGPREMVLVVITDNNS